jgi:hypothetical protein
MASLPIARSIRGKPKDAELIHFQEPLPKSSLKRTKKHAGKIKVLPHLWETVISQTHSSTLIVNEWLKQYHHNSDLALLALVNTILRVRSNPYLAPFLIIEH